MNANAQLDALIVRNIGDVEAAHSRAIDEIDQRIWNEMSATVELAVQAKDGWLGHFSVADIHVDADVNFYASEWRDNANKVRFWFQLEEITGPDGEAPASWVAKAVGDNQQGAFLGLVFDQDVFEGRTRPLLKVMKENHKLRENLANLGFGEKDNRIYLPVKLDQEILAQAFAEDIFDEALAPLSKAITKIVDSRTFFDQLVACMREEVASIDQSGAKNLSIAVPV